VASRAVVFGIWINPESVQIISRYLTPFPRLSIRNCGEICLECRLLGGYTFLWRGGFKLQIPSAASTRFNAGPANPSQAPSQSWLQLRRGCRPRPGAEINTRSSTSSPERHGSDTLPFPSLTTATTLHHNHLRLRPASFPCTIALRPDNHLFSLETEGDYEFTAVTIPMRGQETVDRASRLDQICC
jgi:hypothetical protein